MAAILAHQLSHLRHGDPAVAFVRREGLWSVWGAILEGHLQDGIQMDYSGLEERRAELEAMAMLRSAGITMEPAARFFEEVRVSRAQGTYFAFEYRDFHFGIDRAAKRWAQAAAEQLTQGPAGPALDRQAADDLFNFCWAGALPPVRAPQAPAPPASEPGIGGVAPAPQPADPVRG